jgi:integrase
MKASIIFFPNLHKKSTRHGKIPMYGRIIINRTKAENRLLAEVSETDLQKWDPITMRFIDRSHLANHILNGLDQKFTQFVTINYDRLRQFSARDILTEILGEPKTAESGIIMYCDSYFVETILSNTNLSTGTKKIYKKAINHLKQFLKLRGTEKLEISALSNSLALEFKDYLLKDIRISPTKLKIGMTEPSAAVIVKKFRTIFDRAILEGKLEKNPFKIVKLKHRSPRRGRLSIDEVKRLAELDLTNFEAQKVYRDIFLFSIFTGLAYQDAIYLKRNELQYLPSGEIKLKTDRTKTGVQTELFLVNQAAEIINKYSNSAEQNIRGTILPYRSNKEVNLQLKYLADLANIPMKLTHHISRHTYRQLLAEAEIEDMAVIKKMMGQTRSYDIDDIYYLVTDNKLLAAKQKFQNFLNKQL